MRVTVFGGADPKPMDLQYQDALHLGQLLGTAGHTILTGGYMGTMEAVSRGAAEAGGHVIGVTSDETESWRPAEPNAWVKEQLRFASARERLFALIDNCDAAIALPGGAGTLAEIAVLWKHLLTTSPRPLILVGLGWQEIFDALFNVFPDHAPPSHQAILSFTPTVQAAFDRLERMIANR